MGWVDTDFAKTLVTYGTGAALGTLVKSVVNPEDSFKDWIVQTTSSLVVGVLTGAAVSEFWHLGYWAGLGACAISALISEKLIAFFQARGRSLEKGNIDIGLKKGDGDE